MQSPPVDSPSTSVQPSRRQSTDSNVFIKFNDPSVEADMLRTGSFTPIPRDRVSIDDDGEEGTTNLYLLTASTESGLGGGVPSRNYPIDDEEVPKQHSIVTIFSIWNTMMGTSILAMPWALGQAGFGFGIFLVLFVAGIACYTAILAVQTTEDLKHIKNIPATIYMDISDACDFHFGKAGRIIALIFSQVSLIGASIVYYVLLSNFLFNTGEFIFHEATNQHPVPTVITINGRNFTDVRCSIGDITTPDVIKNVWYDRLWVIDRTVPAWLLFILFPLISIKSPTFLGKFTTLATVSVVYLLILITVKGSSWGINMGEAQHVTNFSKFFPSLTGTCSLALYIHNALQTILRTQKNPENNARDTAISFSFATLTYSIIGISFYVIFPLNKACLSDNLLNNLVTDIPVFIGRLFLLVQMSAVYPMLIYILRAQLMNAIFKSIYPSWRHVFVLHLIVLSLGLLFAIVYPQIGTIIRFVGALCGFVYIFTIPPLVTLLNKRIIGMVTTPAFEVLEQKNEKNGNSLLKFQPEPITQWRDRQTMIWWWVRLAFYVVIIVLGLLNFIAQFVLLGF